MHIQVNGLATEVAQADLPSLLAEHTGKTVFAVAINGDFVPKSNYESVQLKEGDKVDILSPMQGG